MIKHSVKEITNRKEKCVTIKMNFLILEVSLQDIFAKHGLVSGLD